jgi:hypothetical protein
MLEFNDCDCARFILSGTEALQAIGNKRIYSTILPQCDRTVLVLPPRDGTSALLREQYVGI